MKRKNRTKEVKVRLAVDEFNTLNEHVALSGLSKEEYVRSLIEMVVPPLLPIKL